MGIRLFSKSSEGEFCANANPNPKNYVIESQEKIGSILILLVKYPDCKNFEGNKVLVYQDVSLEDLEKQGSIDPHFTDNSAYLSPIARFRPTREGLSQARLLAGMLR